jgi:hypothetical protein
MMATSYPEEVKALQAFLEQDAGMTTVSTIQDDGFGNACTTMTGDTIKVRFTSDRGEWNIQLSPATGGEKWYDVLVLREMLTGVECDDPIPLSDETRLLRENWSDIHAAFRPEMAEQTKAQLDGMLERRAKRMFPGWYE